MLTAFRSLRARASDFPRQYWVLFAGVLIFSIGASMIWPFMTIYMRERLGISLTTVTLLFTLSSITALLGTAFAGPLVDRVGRKGAMVAGIAFTAVGFVAYSFAASLAAWAVLLLMTGLISPLYRVGADAMVADLIPPDKRTNAYALLRMVANLGIVIGPAIGGLITAVSYAAAFYTGAAIQAVYVLILLLFIAETRPKERLESEERRGGYGPVLRDRTYLTFISVIILANMAYTLVMMLMPVYTKENFGLSERYYGLILATNAAMVVLFQYPAMRLIRSYRPLVVMAAGAFLYAIGVGSVALGASFPAFLTSMVIVTLGELILIPTASTYAANRAPADMRGRYMGLYGLGWGVASGIGPVIGGVLNDNVAPAAIWYSGLLMGLAAAGGFLLLQRASRQAAPVAQPEAEARGA